MRIDKYIAVSRHLRAIAVRFRDAIESESYDEEGHVADVIADYIQRDGRDLLHPVVFENSYAHFRAGRLRDAIFNAILAAFDLPRSRTGLDKDGAQLVAEALSLERPRLVISTLSTESGQSEQKGFIQILQGAYLGVRNPKAHSLTSDLDVVKAGQYLVFASLLARRIDEPRRRRRHPNYGMNASAGGSGFGRAAS